MKTQAKPRWLAAMLAGVTLAAVVPVQAHHSFAMYDMREVKVFTGVVTGIDPAPNHLSINFAPMNEEFTGIPPPLHS